MKEYSAAFKEKITFEVFTNKEILYGHVRFNGMLYNMRHNKFAVRYKQIDPTPSQVVAKHIKIAAGVFAFLLN